MSTDASDASSRIVHVVCSLFHPGPHLDRQIETILEQSHRAIRLWLRDDAADDTTRARVEAWQQRDERIGIVPGGDRLGTPGSFGVLMQHALDAGAEWIALADQDDEWWPDHLSDSLVAAAAVQDPTQPILVHGDLELIDEAGSSIAPSFFAHQRIRHEPRDALRILTVQNFVTGCATLVNRPLAELALPIPAETIMHDWWLALCAAASGHIVARETATVRYRQHEGNQIGARAYTEVVRELGQRTVRLKRHSSEPLIQTVEQASALRRRIRARLGAAQPGAVRERMGQAEGLLDRYCALFRPGVSRWRRTFGLAQLGIGRQDRLLDLSLKAKVFTTPIEVKSVHAEDPGSGD